MARSSIQLENDEITFFHANYYYMWKKLNTAPYYVSGSGETPHWIKEPWLLPSYVNLSRCMNPEYAPSLNIVNKIISFYNANIVPEVDTYQFLHEKLENSDSVRAAGSYAGTEDYCGLYRCYYFAGLKDRKKVYGAMMRIAKVHDDTVVQMITGITDDNDIESFKLKDLFAGGDIKLEKYQAYKESLELTKRRTTLYKGMLDLTPGMISIQLQGVDRENSMVMIRCSAAPSMDNHFFGSLGVATMIGADNIQFLMMGIERIDIKGLKPLSLEDPRLIDMLSITKLENEHISINLKKNGDWNDMLLNRD